MLLQPQLPKAERQALLESHRYCKVFWKRISLIITSPITSTKLLFVNEADNSQENKVVNRQGVRSHARTHAARSFRQKHKTGWTTELTGLKMLIPQFPSHHSSCLITFLESQMLVGFESNHIPYGNDISNGGIPTMASSPKAANTETPPLKPHFLVDIRGPTAKHADRRSIRSVWDFEQARDA
jgi:hypothetical protein